MVMAFRFLKFQRVLPFFLRKRALIRSYSEEAQPAAEGTEATEATEKKSVVLGAYVTEDNTFKFTDAATSFDARTGGRLTQLINELGGHIDLGDVQVYHNLDPEFYSVAVAGLGNEKAGLNTFEGLDEAKENARIAAGVGARALQAGGVQHIMVEAFNGQTEAAAEGACLGIWKFQDTKSKDDQKCIPTLDLFEDEDKGGWQRGINKAEAQNIARRLSEMPSNLLTPTLFAQAVVDYLCPCGVQVLVRDKEYIQEKRMNSFLSVSRGSSETPILLECNYSGGGGDDQPIVLVGKGITHDLGGLCRKKCKDMAQFRADMSGAAAIVGTLRAIAALNLPLTVTAVIPLCENVPSGMALKPGDVVTTLNGRSIKVENTDHEGTLILADAFVYSMSLMKPKLLVDVATLTHGARHSLGAGATAAFVTNDKLWQELEKAGAYTGDRMWRLPLWDYYTNKITKPKNADMTNAGIGPGGTTCCAAAFLREFIPCGDWIHLDTHGTGMIHYPADVPYMKEGRMSGRPTRTLIQFLQQIVQLDE